jgi:PKD repeat protein
MVLRVNPLGAQIWARNLVDFGARSLWALDIYMGDLMEVAADSNLVVLGRNQFTPIHPRLVKLDAQGGLIWSKLVTTPSGFSTAYSIVRSPDDGFVLAGASTSKGAIMAVDALGDTLWNQLVDYGPGSEYFLDLMVTSDCRIVACGNYVTSGSQLQVYVARSSTGLYPPQPGFTTTASGATYNFSATSSGYVLAWDWDFGDGNSSTLQNPSHAYAAAGTYQVCLTVSGACGTETICDSVRVTCQFPFSWFGFSGTHFTTNFNDQSTSGGTILSWFWDFGDGTTSSLQNPTHTYPANGTYLVCLTVTDSCGSATHCDSVQITCTVPTALFSSTSSLLNVNFTDQSSSATGIQSWTWDFGDGAGSSLQNPSHAYAAAGTYQVCLTVEDDCDSSSYCDSVPVSVPVGIEEINEGEIALVPNPACNMASLRLPLPITGDLEIDLYAPNGRRLKTQVLPAGSQTINLVLRGLASGIYLLGLKEDGQYIAFRKLAVRR